MDVENAGRSIAIERVPTLTDVDPENGLLEIKTTMDLGVRKMDQPQRPPFVTAANLLTLSRLPLAALLWLRPTDPLLVLGLMAVAGITDVLDGWVERRRLARLGQAEGQGKPSVGVWLDPLCDKIFVLSLIGAIAVTHPVPLWVLPLVALREILQTLAIGVARLIPSVRRRVRVKFRANVLGKLSTVAQFLTIGAILLHSPAQVPLAIGTAAVGALSTAVYIRRSFPREGMTAG
jgi:cardiolipin synthase